MRAQLLALDWEILFSVIITQIYYIYIYIYSLDIHPGISFTSDKTNLKVSEGQVLVHVSGPPHALLDPASHPRLGKAAGAHSLSQPTFFPRAERFFISILTFKGLASRDLSKGSGWAGVQQSVPA